VSDAQDVLYLGDTDATVAHWGGDPRRARVLARPTVSTGSSAFLVELDEPIPAVDGTMLSRVVLADRLKGLSIDRLGVAGSDEHALGWVSVYVLHLVDPAWHADRLEAGEYSIEAWAEVALDVDRLPRPFDEGAFWAATLTRIRRFIDEHGHSRVPDRYFDDVGRLDVIVENLRWHHAGKAGISPGPFPSIDYAAVLDALAGWEW
jgi:hypothetical protein